MSGPVVFSTADFIRAYPVFANLDPTQLESFFDMSDAFFENSTANFSYASGLDRMTRLAYMVTAHLAWLMSPKDANGNPAVAGSVSGTVGQITSASEGSVSVGLDAVAKGGNELAAWFAQTPYGFMYWQATAQYRRAMYFPNPTAVVGIGTGLFPRRPW